MRHCWVLSSIRWGILRLLRRLIANVTNTQKGTSSVIILPPHFGPGCGFNWRPERTGLGRGNERCWKEGRWRESSPDGKLVSPGLLFMISLPQDFLTTVSSLSAVTALSLRTLFLLDVFCLNWPSRWNTQFVSLAFLFTFKEEQFYVHFSGYLIKCLFARTEGMLLKHSFWYWGFSFWSSNFLLIKHWSVGIWYPATVTRHNSHGFLNLLSQFSFGLILSCPRRLAKTSFRALFILYKLACVPYDWYLFLYHTVTPSPAISHLATRWMNK